MHVCFFIQKITKRNKSGDFYSLVIGVLISLCLFPFVVFSFGSSGNFVLDIVIFFVIGMILTGLVLICSWLFLKAVQAVYVFFSSIWPAWREEYNRKKKKEK